MANKMLTLTQPILTASIQDHISQQHHIRCVKAKEWLLWELAKENNRHEKAIRNIHSDYKHAIDEFAETALDQLKAIPKTTPLKNHPYIYGVLFC